MTTFPNPDCPAPNKPQNQHQSSSTLLQSVPFCSALVQSTQHINPWISPWQPLSHCSFKIGGMDRDYLNLLFNKSWAAFQEARAHSRIRGAL